MKEEATSTERAGKQSDSAKRLRALVKAAGGPALVARKAGMHIGSLNNHLAGGEMKLTAALAIADACGVSLNFLARGFDANAKDLDIEILKPAILNAPVHFTGWLIVSQSCQEYFERTGQKPTLAEALAWISPNYVNAMSLPHLKFKVTPDGKPPETI